MFLGIEAIDEEGLKMFRKRVTLSQNFEALEFACSLGVTVAINLIADPSWDRDRFRVIREWCRRSLRLLTSASTPRIRAPRVGGPKRAGFPRVTTGCLTSSMRSCRRI